MIEQLLSITFITGFLAAAIRMATPILITALGEMVSERSGIMNLGIEGIMMIGAFSGFCMAYESSNLWLGFLAGGLAGAILGLLMGFVSTRYQANQIVTGVGIWILCGGLSSLLNRHIFGSSGISVDVPTFTTIAIPLLSDLPILGDILFNQNIIVYLTLLSLFLFDILFNKTAWGLNIDAAGENPRAADSAGLNVTRIRTLSTAFGGMLAGFGGAYLPLAFFGLYTDDLTTGLGWMAIVVVVFGRWRPWSIAGGALIFGAANSLQFRLQTLKFPLPYQFLLMMPFIITLIFVIFFVRGENGPSALTRPYDRSKN